MYAVIADKAIHYLGSNSDRASLEAAALEGKVVQVDSIEDLAQQLLTSQIADNIESFVEGLSAAAQKVLERLDKSGLNAQNAEQLGATVRDKADRAVAEVRSLGLKSMKTVGDSFVAIGDLLHKASQSDDKE